MAGKGAKYKDPSRVSKSSNDKEETKENYASLQQPLPGKFLKHADRDFRAQN